MKTAERHRLKHNEVADTVQDVWAGVQTNRRSLVAGLAIILVLISSVGAWTYLPRPAERQSLGAPRRSHDPGGHSRGRRHRAGAEAGGSAAENVSQRARQAGSGVSQVPGGRRRLSRHHRRYRRALSRGSDVGSLSDGRRRPGSAMRRSSIVTAEACTARWPSWGRPS